MEHIWNLVKLAVKNKLDPENYSIWIEPLDYKENEGNRIILSAPTTYLAEHVLEHYGDLINKSLQSLDDRGLMIAFEGVEQPEPEPEPEKKSDGPPIQDSGNIVSEHTFENFVVGNCNKFAHAASLAVTESLGERQYNPLFIYGSTGLGKTHLLHAIANQVRKRHPQMTTRYVTAEQFTNELINSFRLRTYDAFHQKYRVENSVLLIDDAQFFTGKERTQEELFHTFEFLTGKGNQIVFTADVLPRNIDDLEPRLRTRFESGVIIDMQPPDLETLTAIVTQKSLELGMEINANLALYIATGVDGNIREINGVLNRLKTLSQFTNKIPTLEFAREHIGQILSHQNTQATADDIIEAVCNVCAVRMSDIKGKSRHKKIVRPRHIAMYMVRSITNLSFPEIAKIFGDRDQSTIQHGVKKIQQSLPKDPNLQSTLLLIKRNLS